MAGKVSNKSNIQTKKTKFTKSSKGSGKANRVPEPAKARSKIISSSLKKAMAQSSKVEKKRAPKTGKSVVSKKIGEPKAIKAAARKTIKSQPSTGKNQLRQVAKQLATVAELKAQKKKVIVEKVAAAKEKVKQLKAIKAAEEEQNAVLEKKAKKMPTPEPIFDEEVKASPLDAGLPPVLTDAEGRPYCKVKDCDQIATVEGYCRYHYLLLWKKIQVRRKILVDGKLERYVEELTARYPDKFLEVIRKDLQSEKSFLAAISELEIDESNNDSDFGEEDTQSIEEVRGFSDSNVIADDDF